MNAYLPFILIGLVSGSAYALVALGLVLTYRTSGIFNFAHGGIAMVAAYAYYSLNVTAHLPTAYAILIAVFVIAPAVGIILDRFVFRYLVGASPAGRIVATVGLLILLQALAVIIYGGDTIQINQILPQNNYRIGSLNVSLDQIIVMVGVLVAAILLRTFYQFTKLGLNTRALVDNNELTQIEGVRTHLITATSWAIGCAFAGLAGVILVPTIGLDSTALTLLVLQGFGAAAFGGLISLPWTYVGAIVIGVAASLVTKVAATVPALVGLPSSLPFVALFIAVLFIGNRRKSSTAGSVVSSLSVKKPNYFNNEILRKGTWGIWFAALIVLPPLLNGSWLLAATGVGCFAIVFSSLYIVIGLTRQVSLCHGVFVAIGVVTMAHLAEWHIPYVVMLLTGGLIAAAVAAVVSLPSVRLAGIYFALLTFAFALLMDQLVWPTSIGFGINGQVEVPRPWGLGGNQSFYWFVLAVAIVTVFAVNRLVRSRLGRFNRALSDSQMAVMSLGVRPAGIRVLSFSLSAFVAAIGGGLLGGLYGTNDPSQFAYSQSLMFVAVLVTCGVMGQSGVVLGAILFAGIPVVFTWSWLSEWSGVFFGLNAMVYAGSAEGLIGPNRLLWVWATSRLRSLRPAPQSEPHSMPFLERQES
jgi:branched-subunit amino acid ABC-type transport system permease component